MSQAVYIGRPKPRWKRLSEAEAKVAVLEEALRKIASSDSHQGAIDIARHALEATA